jgi:Arc/MetJ family transcription regulator
MRVTIDIDARALKQIQKLTRQNKKSPAISEALTEFIRLRQKRQFVERVLSGQTDYTLTNQQLEDQDVYETR